MPRSSDRRRHITFIARDGGGELQRIYDCVRGAAWVAGLAESRQLLADRVALGEPARETTLDLIGHSLPNGTLGVGDWIVNACHPTTTAWCQEVVGAGLLERLGIRAVRLLGCETVVTRMGRATVIGLARLLGVEVYGTRTMVYAGQFDEHGYSDAHRHILIGAHELTRA